MTATVSPSTLRTGVLCNGIATVVTTTQQSGESNADFAARHLAAVAAARSGCSGTASIEPSKWTTPVTCEGVTTDVLTTQGTGESWAAFQARHEAAVAAAVAACG